MDAFDEFFWLFAERDYEKLTAGQKEKMRCVGNLDFAIERYVASKPMFEGYEEFLCYMRKQ